MKIWLQKHAIQGRIPELDAWYQAHIAAVVHPGTEVVIRTLPRRTYRAEIPCEYVSYGALALKFNAYFANTALQAEREGYDAWVIAAGQDPGLPQARTLATIPTLGYGSTTFHYCAQNEIRFGLIGFIPGLREPIMDNLHRYRTHHLLSSYALIPGGKNAVLSAIEGHPDPFLEEFAKAASEAAALGAQVIIPAEGLPTEILWHHGVRHLAGLPVLDPLGLLLKSAENEVQLRSLGCVARPSTGYWFNQPDKAVLDHIESVFPISPIEHED